MTNRLPDEMKKQNCAYIVRGMRCAGCSKNLEKAISRLPGAENVSVNYATGTLSLTVDRAQLDEETIFATAKKMGFRSEEHTSELQSR